MKGEIWTMSLHKPVDTRKLDQLARGILKQALVWYIYKNATLTPSHREIQDQETKLLNLITSYKGEVFNQVLAEEDLPS